MCKFYFMPLHVSCTCARHQEVKIALHSLWYHHTYRWPSCASFISCLYMFRAHVLIIRRSKLHYTASGIVTPIGGRLVHGLRDDSYCKTKFCASSWLNTEINILRCTISKTSKSWYSVVSLGLCNMFHSKVGLRTYQHPCKALLPIHVNGRR